VAAAGAVFTARSWSQVAGANNDIRLAIAGLNGRGQGFINAFRATPGVRIVALCDVDTASSTAKMAHGRARGDALPDRVIDYRDLPPRADIDAIVIATRTTSTPCKASWRCRPAKDVIHEKPVTHTSGRARRSSPPRNRTSASSRSSRRTARASHRRGIAWMQAGHLGKLNLVRGLVYKRRLSIGKTTGPVAPPATVNYDLFQGPAPLVPLRRVNFHYDWHWQWATGNGDMVAQGNHQLDIGRRLLGDRPPGPRVHRRRPLRLRGRRRDAEHLPRPLRLPGAVHLRGARPAGEARRDER